MAFASDRLRERYQAKQQMPNPSAPGPEEEEQEDDGEAAKPSDRSVQLTDMEQKAFAGTMRPGEEVTCEVVGRMDGDGTFDINEIRPSGGPVDEGAPPMRMNPAIAPS
jgi:hypothetical protein